MTRPWIPEVADVAVTEIAATRRLLIALDFDGTASPLVDEPMAARALPEVIDGLDRLRALPDTTIAYVSGRSMRDLRVIAEHSDDSAIALAASHGAEYWLPGTGPVDAGDVTDPVSREALWDAVQPIIDRYQGVVLERKTYGMAVHTRRAAADLEAPVFEEVDALMVVRAPHWRRRVGHRVLEFSARTEGKDAAIGVLREHLAATGVLFAGDDVTDEDALRSLIPGDLGVRVGPGETAATLRVDGPEQIAGLLAQVATERAARRE